MIPHVISATAKPVDIFLCSFCPIISIASDVLAVNFPFSPVHVRTNTKDFVLVARGRCTTLRLVT